MILNQWPVYKTKTGTPIRYVTALPVDSIKQNATGSAVLSFAGGYGSVEVDDRFMSLWNPVSGGYAVQDEQGQLTFVAKATFEAAYETTAPAAVVADGSITAAKLADGSVSSTKLAANAVTDPKVAAAAAVKGTKLVTAAAATSAGGTVTVPAGTTVDAAIKIILDAVDPSAA